MATRKLEQEVTSSEEPGDIEFGAFAPHDSKPRGPALVVASYNIRYAVGSRLISGSVGRRLGFSMPGRRSRLVEGYLRKAARILTDGRLLPAPDILALQEADRQTLRAGRLHVARELASRLRMDYAFAPADAPSAPEPEAKQWYLDFEEHLSPSEEGRTGVALLSRVPLAAVNRVDLPWRDCPWRPKLALSASVLTGGVEVRVFNSHIDPHASLEGQLEQHEAVIALADKSGGPAIMLGDFNTLSRRSCLAVRGLLESKGFRTPFPTGTATWRSGPIRLHTDWVFVRGLRVRRWGVARPFGISDHWPVWAEVEVGGGQ